MAILKIARMGHPVLGRTADPVGVPTAPDIRRLIADGAIAIKDGVIVDVGATSDVTSRWHSDKRTYASGDIAAGRL